MKLVTNGSMDQSAVSTDNQRLDRNREQFEQLLARACRYAERGWHDLAATWAEMAADQGFNSHPGFFADDRLEELLARIGLATMTRALSWRVGGSDWPRRVLHVLTEAYPIGGHTRLVWRWIEADRGRRHCVVLTRHKGPLPPPLLAAPQATGGWVRALDWRHELSLERAGQLRALSAEFDLVVLHAHAFDSVPAIAFASGGPPIVLLNHNGFSFWIGREIADVVACLRPSSRDVAVTRRGIAPHRCPPLPIPVNAPDTGVSRSKARELLGLSADAVVLFTVATPFKYVPFEPGCSFVDLVTALALAHKRVEVRAIGPDDRGMWRKAREQTGGRVQAIGRHPGVGLHERAADIYLDPFPVTSPTSFLEAGSYGLPIVSFCPHRDRAAVLCADDFTLDDQLVRTDSAKSFSTEVGRLIEDDAARAALGRATAEKVIAGHGPEAFADRLAEVYARVATVHAAGRFAAGDIGGAGPLDCCLARMQEAAGWPLLWEVTARHCDSLPYLPRQWMRLKARLARRLACRPSAPSHAHTCHSTSHGEVR
jgi:glycosyltransferase involved in cell wall biosynthesis